MEPERQIDKDHIFYGETDRDGETETRSYILERETERESFIY